MTLKAFQTLMKLRLNVKGEFSEVGHIDSPRVWFLGRALAQSTGSLSKEHDVSE